ncbi:MAG: flavin reductase family protein [Nanoarchaeota archaeon]
MDLPWGDEKTKQFITNVGLITSTGPYGDNIMAAEWTHHISYSPGLIAVCIKPVDATHDNISKTKEFGVNITSTEQPPLVNIAGGYTGKQINKISALNELGFNFYKGNKIKCLMLEGAALNLECKVIKEISLGDHTMFVGEVLEASLNQDKEPLAFHKGMYGIVNFDIKKPSQEEREKINQIVMKYKKDL